MKTIFTLLFVVSLLACGGGGGESTVVDNRPSYSLSGTANVLTNTVVDSDVNDPNALYSSNNTASTAQVLPPIAVVSGYLASHFTGVSGDRFANMNDSIDIYRVDLEAGQTLFLEIADWETSSNDFDLSLYRVSDETEVASSIGTNKTELIQVTVSDSYYVVVDAYLDNQLRSQGPYTLRLIDQNQQNVPESTSLSTQHAFMVDEMIIQRSEQQFRATNNEDYGLSSVASGPSMSLYRAEENLAVALATSADSPSGLKPSNNAEYLAKKRTLLKIKELKYRLGSDEVTPNYLYQASALSNDPLVERQWHYEQIGLSAAWQTMQGQTQSDVVVAVLDTGMFENHPDLTDQLTTDGMDFISNTQISLDGDGVDTDPEDPGDKSGTNGSSSWHGTHVAGTVAARTNNSVGVAGVAPDAKIMNLRVLGFGGGTTFDISQAVLYAAGLSNSSGRLPNKAADVINMSLGGGGFDSAFNKAVQDAVAQGVIVVAAAGNESTSQLSYPAAFDNVIGVSAVDARKQLTSYSNYGTYIDIAAPGGNSSVDLNGDGYGDGVYSTYVNESGSNLSASYQYLNGTSMAAPHVAGGVALMKQLNPQLNTSSFLSLLANGKLSDDIGASGKDSSFGYGLFNAEKAVQSQLDLLDPDRSYLSLSISQISLSAQESEVSFNIQSIGPNALTVTRVEEQAAWLTVDSSATDGSGLGSYVIEASRDGLSDGNYSADITITGSDSSQHIVAVSMVVSTQQASDNGLVYILLLDSETSETKYTQLSSMSNGVFSFNFAEVREGSYRLYVSTDLDNDYVICDQGELCGAYPVRNNITPVEVSSDLKELSLSVEPIVTEDVSNRALPLNISKK
ncbi:MULTISPECIES: S8 family peptidase [unclassified Agarivorans]|uniref:S8 family peptidase n=1 Tax=unclassified Agarivorans TaxID=2636026 RepID=UPI0026E45A16|nr:MULTISPECIES: S8 family peptidase [unclassified Agarivorans]MDO6687826.1 S8 family peptidase [Agarivorans sp. 3_MG-2023]MDO6717448.1 S8 family peptidase [Agarivorans sp. 2_MG-2023]